MPQKDFFLFFYTLYECYDHGNRYKNILMKMDSLDLFDRHLFRKKILLYFFPVRFPVYRTFPETGSIPKKQNGLQDVKSSLYLRDHIDKRNIQIMFIELSPLQMFPANN